MAELFDLLKYMFESPSSYEEVSKGDKRKNFFMVNRRLSVQYPVQANMLQHVRINMEATVDWWQRFLRKSYTKTPYWMFIKGVKKNQKEEEKKINISAESMSAYARFYGIDLKSVRDSCKFFPEKMVKEIKDIENMIKELK